MINLVLKKIKNWFQNIEEEQEEKLLFSQLSLRDQRKLLDSIPYDQESEDKIRGDKAKREVMEFCAREFKIEDVE